MGTLFLFILSLYSGNIAWIWLDLILFLNISQDSGLIFAPLNKKSANIIKKNEIYTGRWFYLERISGTQEY